jgi:hypothetical protein
MSVRMSAPVSGRGEAREDLSVVTVDHEGHRRLLAKRLTPKQSL